jgi:hypothetical protein
MIIMTDLIASLRAEIKRLSEKPCMCVMCNDCHGSGHVWVDSNSYPEDDLVPCDACNGGVIETCERCREIEELYEQIEEEEFRQSEQRRKVYG